MCVVFISFTVNVFMVMIKRDSYVSVMVFLQDDTTVTPAAVARVAWMAETILKKESAKIANAN